MPPPGTSQRSVTGLLVSSNLLEGTPPVGLRTIFRRFWPETRPFRGRVWASLLLVAAGPLLSAATIWLFKILVDDVLTPHSFRYFPALAAAYIGISVLEGVVSFSDQYLSTWVGERFVLNLRSRLFADLHRQSSQFFERHQLGDILSRLTGDISAIEQLVLSGLADGLTYAFQLIFFTAALFYLNWQMALASLIAAPGFLLIARSFSRRIKDASREKRRRASSITTVAEESFSNAALVRAYGRRASESDRFDEENLGSFTAQMTATRLQALFGPLTDLIEVVGVLLVMGLAVWELTNNNITLGGLLVFVAYLTQLYGPLQGLGQLTNSLFAASASAERVMELLDLAPTITEPTHPVPLRRALGYLRVREVGFAYPDTDRPALARINFEVRPGQRVAIVGASGSGKSTLAKLLLRFYDPSRGSISLDGTDLRDLSESDLRRNIATVLQETLVFDGTIRENIAWGRPEATDADIVAAATAADAHEFISALPEGYDSRIGQRGRLLSGGQRQRLAIARAMIRDAPVLLLDEPTTGLDAESTRRVLEPLRRLMVGRTTIIISHNLLTVTDADLILLLDHGRISAAGTHRELLATSPGYARLYHLHQAPPALEGPAEIRPSPAVRPSPGPTPLLPDPRDGAGLHEDRRSLLIMGGSTDD
jgi:ATP-binding cassette, subfamily B, bacterial